MSRKTTSSQHNKQSRRDKLAEITSYIVVFITFLIGSASVASFIGLIVTAFAYPALCMPLICTFVLTLRLAYGIVQILLRPDKP